MGEPIGLEIDHINGDKGNNKIENLRLLCPNCHSQTWNYKRKFDEKQKMKFLLLKRGFPIKQIYQILGMSISSKGDRVRQRDFDLINSNFYLKLDPHLDDLLLDKKLNQKLDLILKSKGF